MVYDSSLYMFWKFWKKQVGVAIVKCVKCKLFISTGNPGKVPKITHVFWDMCESCQNKERGIIGLKRPDETGLR